MPLSIAVCVKRVPDTAADKVLDHGDFTLDRDGVESILGPVDEVAVEEALRLKEAHGGEVTVVSVGPEGAVTAIRRALSMGCDKGVHLSDPALHGSDAIAIAYALAQVLRRGTYDLILCGSESTDARTSLVPPALAEFLGLPGLAGAGKVEVEGASVRIQRERDNGYDVVEAALPAVVGVNWGANEPRYPSFMGIRSAKTKPLEELTVDAAGVDAARVGLEGSRSVVTGFRQRSADRRHIVVDNKAGDAAARLADFLTEEHFI